MRWWRNRLKRADETAKPAWHLALLAGLGVLLLGALLAKWTWVLLAPRNIAAPAATGSVASAEPGNLFGVATISSVPAQVSALPNVRLIGVFSGPAGFAVLELDGNRQLGVAIGSEVAPGAKLVEVNADHVVIERGGVRQQVPLEGKASAVKSAAAAVAVTIPASSVDAARTKP